MRTGRRTGRLKPRPQQRTNHDRERVGAQTSCPMIKLSRLLLLVAITELASVLFLSAQISSPELEREIQAGKKAADESNYADARAHFIKANQLQQNTFS